MFARFQRFALIAAALAVCATSASAFTMIEGKSNGATQKYTQQCLDAAYKNAYGEASGKKTTSEDFSNFRCYKDGK